MGQIRLYHVSREDLGQQAFLIPDVPTNTGSGEDTVTPRVCACLTIPGCIRAGEFCFDDPVMDGDDGEALYVYAAYVDMEDVFQPGSDQVPDAWFTGELWVMKPVRWIRVAAGTLRKHLSYNVSCQEPEATVVYSRYAFTIDGYDEVVDRAGATAIYGDEDSFSVLEFDPVRTDRLETR